MESNIEEAIDMKNKLRNKNSPDPIGIREAASEKHVDTSVNDTCMIKKSAHVDFNDKNLDNVRFDEVNSILAVNEHLTAKHYVHQAFSRSVDESSLIRLGPDEKSKRAEQGSKIPNFTLTSRETLPELTTKSYVESLSENNRNRRDSFLLIDDQDNEIDSNKLFKLNSFTKFNLR